MLDSEEETLIDHYQKCAIFIESRKGFEEGLIDESFICCCQTILILNCVAFK